VIITIFFTENGVNTIVFSIKKYKFVFSIKKYKFVFSKCCIFGWIRIKIFILEYWQRFRPFILHSLKVLNHVLTIFDRFERSKTKDKLNDNYFKMYFILFRALGVIFGIIILSLITASTIFVIYYCKTKKENIKAIGHLNGKFILFFNILRFCLAPWLFYSGA